MHLQKRFSNAAAAAAAEAEAAAAAAAAAAAEAQTAAEWPIVYSSALSASCSMRLHILARLAKIEIALLTAEPTFIHSARSQGCF